MKIKSTLIGASGILSLIMLVLFSCQKDIKQSPSVTSDAKAGSQSTNVYGTPTLSCAGSTLESIDLTFTPGAGGAPSGFSIQWMTKTQFALGADGIANTADDNKWPVYTAANTDINGDPIAASFCKASFSGNAFMSRYNLKEGESITVTIGDLLLDNGASVAVGCNSDLVCSTDYVFRAFSHGDSKKNRSAFSANQTCSTLPCPGEGVTCIHGSLGYWKHQDVNAFPLNKGLTIGGITYTGQQLLDILNNSDAGNGYVILAHQYIPALLNIATGANYDDNAAGLAAAEAYFNNVQIPTTVGSATRTLASTARTLISGINKGNHTCH